ncbi:unnamed protein product [Paramecium pentaurelia]|uniref:Uncharacterized protein n=1 Tax=Paramecium pentaurelia TaxID=43138 RepID=A0A8S1TGZ5_9CILI|nr:unnamed protein product [Paramecium pentaurelia]
MNPLLFEEALGEEDEYQRLTKISDAIKLVAGAIMRIRSFNNWQILKYMICSYPFQQEVIQLLMNTIFDYFQDIDFLNAFEKALLEIAQLKEQRVFLSSRSQSLRIGVLQQNYNNMNIRNEQLKQSSIPFAKTVIEQLTVAKKFAASFIKKYIILAKNLNQDIKERVYIIKDFVVNTRDHHFIILLINTFEELKEFELRDQSWIVHFDHEIEQYCVQHNILVPHFIEKQNRHKQFEQSSSESDSEEDKDSESQKHESSNSNSCSDRQSQIDEEELIQKWIAQKEFIIEQQQIITLSKDENLIVLISFLLNPNEELIDDCWKDQYPIEDLNNDGISQKIRNQKIEFHAIVRSFKTAQMFHHRQNLEKLQQYNQTFLKIFFKQTSEAFKIKNRNLNLNHLTLTIDSFLTVFPKSSMALILENQILFDLSTYIYNPLIMGLLIDIHQIQLNKYDFGLSFIEQIWKYQLFADWFMWVQNILSEKENDYNQLEQQMKSENIEFIIKSLKELSKKEQKIIKPKNQDDNKIKLTQLFGSLQSGKNLIKQNTKDYENWKLNSKIKEHLTIEEFKTQDYDNLMDFTKQRDQIYKQQLEKKISDEIQIQIDNIQLKRSSRIRMSQSNNNHYLSPMSNSKFNLHTNSSIQSQSDSQPNSSRSIKLPSIYTNNQYTESKFNAIQSFSSQGEINIDLKTRNLSSFGQSPKNSKLGLASQRRLKTENDDNGINSIQSNDGFSSSRLITIYPTKQAQIKFEQSKSVQRQDQIIVENCLRFFSEILRTILDYFQQPNKTNLQQLNEQILIQQILSMNFLNSIFEIYLSSLIDQNIQQQKIGEICGQLINQIYFKSHHIELFQLLREQLRTLFLANVDNLTRAIVAINKQIRLQSKFVNKCQLQLLLQTYFFGFNLFSIHTQLPSTSNIYKHLNETVMHIFIIWFFDSQQNNCYQYFFTKFLTILFAKAPIQSLTNILFNIGLINSIYNAFQSFWINGMKSNCFEPGVYFYLRMIIYVINKSLNHRNMTILQEYLQPLESWKGVKQLIPDEDSNYMIELQELLKTGQTPIRKIQLKRTKLEKLKSQLTVDCFDSKLKEIKQFEQAQLEKQKQSSTPKVLQQGKKLPNRLSQRSLRNRASLKNDN